MYPFDLERCVTTLSQSSSRSVIILITENHLSMADNKIGVGYNKNNDKKLDKTITWCDHLWHDSCNYTVNACRTGKLFVYLSFSPPNSVTVNINSHAKAQK